MYGANGWTMHHTTDVFGKTAVIDGVYWGMFPLGGAWMTLPLWEHFVFTNDTIYLREHAYPIMKGAAEFIRTFLSKIRKAIWLLRQLTHRKTVMWNRCQEKNSS